MTDIVRFADLESLSQEAARRWGKIAQKAVQERGKFRIALSGGNTPRRLYQLVAAAPLSEQLPWAQTYVFWGDERRVPPSHPDSDYRMARETLLDHVPVPEGQIFRMHGEGLASDATRDYEIQLQREFELGVRDWPDFDLVLLGLGAEGHTASIFPGTRAVSDLTHMVLIYDVPQLGSERMTLTRPVFNHARNILFLVSGKDKADALAGAIDGPGHPSTYPAAGIKPENGLLTWLVDEPAASKLKSVVTEARRK
jgi:6-phosphogluconolactonase